MKKKVALITGITGQDGSYLLEFLLRKNYIVHGTKRRTSQISSTRIDKYFKESHFQKELILHYCDMTDGSSLSKLVSKIKPDEIYNLAAQSHVGVSFLIPEYTSEVNALGVLKLLEAIRSCGKKIKIYQASTSEIFGDTKSKYQNEGTPLNPCSPYAASKVYAQNIIKNYRDAYKMFAVNGILFNHESPRRGEFFVTRKIVIGLVKIKLGLSNCLYLGNIESKRDWGHANEYVEAMWKMLQQKKTKDYVISTGRQYSIKEFIKLVCHYLNIPINFKGKGIKTIGISKGKIIVKCSKLYFRPSDVTNLRGDSNLATKELKWKAKIGIKELVKEMVDFELVKYTREANINERI